jgi:hypothetical protein
MTPKPVPDPNDPFAGKVWLTAKEAAAYVCNKSVRGWYDWRRRHGILTRNNGTVLKRDLERELARRKPRRIMARASLANLQQRRRAP